MDFYRLQIVQPGFEAHSVCCWMDTDILSAVNRPGRGADRSAHLAPRWAIRIPYADREKFTVLRVAYWRA